jgi:SAM-dependent methyltransferase
MSNEVRQQHVAVWEKLYAGGHVMSYPSDVFVRLTHRLISPDRHPKALDYGFGSGQNLLHLGRRGFKLWGLEVSESAVKTARGRLEAAGLQGELALIKDEKLPFADGFFDVVVPWQVLNYNTWESLRRVVKELDRVLRPGGFLIAAINAPGDYQQTHSEPLGDCLYRLTSSTQAGLVTLVPERDRLKDVFPGYPLNIGSFSYSYEDNEERYWIVTYEKK